jgi:hypothetical protein
MVPDAYFDQISLLSFSLFAIAINVISFVWSQSDQSLVASTVHILTLLTYLL